MCPRFLGNSFWYCNFFPLFPNNISKYYYFCLYYFSNLFSIPEIYFCITLSFNYNACCGFYFILFFIGYSLHFKQFCLITFSISHFLLNFPQCFELLTSNVLTFMFSLYIALSRHSILLNSHKYLIFIYDLDSFQQ